jgi:L-fuculose-phosphate aldolase
MEYPIHTEILAARPDVGGVVHTHAPSVIAFAATGRPLRPISHDASLFVPPEISRFEDTGDLIVTSELGTAVASSLGRRNAVILIHHGLVTVGPDIALATIYAVLLERACDSQLRSESAGGVATWSSDEEALSKRARHGAEGNLRSAFEYLERVGHSGNGG